MVVRLIGSCPPANMRGEWGVVLAASVINSATLSSLGGMRVTGPAIPSWDAVPSATPRRHRHHPRLSAEVAATVVVGVVWVPTRTSGPIGSPWSVW